MHTLSIVAWLPVAVLAAGGDVSVVIVKHGARWADVLAAAKGIVAPGEMDLLSEASAHATCDVVLHRDLPEGLGGPLQLFVMHR